MKRADLAALLGTTEEQLRLSPKAERMWAEYMAVEPCGFPALDIGHGMQCAAMKGARADPRDYMIKPPAKSLPWKKRH
jgi:hypothetical protein